MTPTIKNNKSSVDVVDGIDKFIINNKNNESLVINKKDVKVNKRRKNDMDESSLFNT